MFDQFRVHFQYVRVADRKGLWIFEGEDAQAHSFTVPLILIVIATPTRGSSWVAFVFLRS
jgi:hypothetical protein